jgi:hypothetical protein
MFANLGSHEFVSSDADRGDILGNLFLKQPSNKPVGKENKMRLFVFAVIVLSTVMVLGGMAESQNTQLSAPPDVAISNWIPLGESFGFVIVNTGKTTKPKQPGQPALSGYFMVKRGDVWSRLIDEWPLRVVPLAQK